MCVNQLIFGKKPCIHYIVVLPLNNTHYPVAAKVSIRHTASDTLLTMRKQESDNRIYDMINLLHKDSSAIFIEFPYFRKTSTVPRTLGQWRKTLDDNYTWSSGVAINMGHTRV